MFPHNVKIRWEPLLVAVLAVFGFILVITAGIVVLVAGIPTDQWVPACGFAMGIFGVCMAHSLELQRRIRRLESMTGKNRGYK